MTCSNLQARNILAITSYKILRQLANRTEMTVFATTITKEKFFKTTVKSDYEQKQGAEEYNMISE